MPASRIALVTRGASGIGQAVARRFVARGINTIMIDRLDGVVAQKGGSAKGYVVELSDEKALRAWLEATLARQGVIDIVLNNAGIHPKKQDGKHLIEEIDLPQWRQVLDINLTGAVPDLPATVAGNEKARMGSGRQYRSAGALIMQPRKRRLPD